MNLAAELQEMAGQPAAEFMPPVPAGNYDDKLIQAKRGLERFQVEAEEMRNAVNDLVIKDVAGSARGSELKAMAQKISKKIDARVKEITTTDDIQAVLEYIQAVKNFGANLKAPLSEARAEADRKLSIWAEYERMERAKQARAAQEAIAKAQAKINKEAEKKGIEAVILPDPTPPPQKTVIRTDSGTTYFQENWTYTITDPDQVDRKYCSPDPKKIKEAIKGGVRNPHMSGVDIRDENKPITRTK